MEPSSNIYVYAFTGARPARGAAADDRIRRCAGLFAEAEGFPTGLVLPEIRREPGKKPCFSPDTGFYFSVSHSGDCWVCALSGQEVGIDIEKRKQRNTVGIAKRFFHPEEQAYLEKNGHQDFFDLWTAKESYVKYTGRGIDRGFGGFSVVAEGRFAGAAGTARLGFLSLDPLYSMCLCAGAIGAVFVEKNPF